MRSPALLSRHFLCAAAAAQIAAPATAATAQPQASAPVDVRGRSIAHTAVLDKWIEKILFYGKTHACGLTSHDPVLTTRTACGFPLIAGAESVGW